MKGRTGELKGRGFNKKKGMIHYLLLFLVIIFFNLIFIIIFWQKSKEIGSWCN